MYEVRRLLRHSGLWPGEAASLSGAGRRRRPLLQDYSRRPVSASHFDQFYDFDGDGRLDLFKGGVEPYVYCYQNVGGNRFVPRGRLTSGGSLFTLPRNPKSNRSWVTVAFYDWDGDAEPDFFPSFMDGPDAGQIVFYRNTTRQHGGVLTFTRVGPLKTVSGIPVAGGPQAGGWFPSITFVRDWDGHGDGRTDILAGSNNHCYLYRNLGSQSDGLPRLADAVPIQAGGKDIVLVNPRFDCADIHGDGRPDLFAGTQPGPVYWFRNIGTRTRPVFDQGRVIAFGGKYLIGDAHSGVKVADFDGDGLPDVVVGRFWERTDLAEPDSPRDFGGFYKNVGTRSVAEVRAACRGLAAAPRSSRFAMRCGRTASGQWTGTATARRTSWRATPTGLSGYSATRPATGFPCLPRREAAGRRNASPLPLRERGRE